MNFRHPWYSPIHAVEQKFGFLAFPGLIRALAIFQFLVVLIARMQPEYVQMLTFDWEKIASGQVWRLFTCIFIPKTLNLFWGLIAMMLLWFISDLLEQAWGAFQVTLFTVASVVLFLGALLLLPNPFQIGMSYAGGYFLFETLFLAAAAIVPNYEIRLFFVIPIKMKWMALVVVAIMLYQILLLTGMIGIFAWLPFLAMLTPFMLVFFPRFAFEIKHRQKSAIRRARFQSAQISEDDAFHKCAKCGKTEHDDPDAEFRIEDDDEEYCLDCLPADVQPEA